MEAISPVSRQGRRRIKAIMPVKQLAKRLPTLKKKVNSLTQK
jgi:hypothetical protein